MLELSGLDAGHGEILALREVSLAVALDRLPPHAIVERGVVQVAEG